MSLPPIAAPPPDADAQQLEQIARHVLEEIATADGGTDGNVTEYIRILSEYRQDCESRSQYREAELVQQVLKHLHLEEETRHVRGLDEQQDMERRGVEHAHAKEFERFNALWNERIDAFEEYQLEKEGEMLERHAQELSNFRSDVARAQPRPLKYSKDLLNLRSMQRTLASMRNYADAERVKRKGDRIEAVECERLARDKGTTYDRREETILHRHRQELAALRKRVERQRMELERNRKRELEMLLQRYNNVRRDLAAQQTAVRSRTGMLLLKHANNKKSDNSGSDMICKSISSGVFGPALKRRIIVAHDDVVDEGDDGLSLPA